MTSLGIRTLSRFAIVFALAGITASLLVVMFAMMPTSAFAEEGSGQSADPTLTTGTTPSQSAANVAKPTDEEKLAGVNLKIKAKVQTTGWKDAVKAGKTAGTKSKKGLRALKISLTGLNGVSGSIRYKAFATGKKWGATAKDGKGVSGGKSSISAMKIWLTGKVSTYYDVYYRGYIKGYGWLDWASNKQVAGTTKLSEHLSAIQVKLVKKGSKFEGKTKTYELKSQWKALEFKYRDNKTVSEILEVKYRGGSKADVVLREKRGSKWKTTLSCKGYVGKNGAGKAREGLARTPMGDFGITSAFGIKSDPGSALPYVKVTDSMYWCSDREYYNELIDIDESPHDCTGEHLIDYSPHYDYGLFFDYNTNPVKYGAGSAFFVHCTGGTPYTGGCIAVSKSNMVKIIRKVSTGARLCIYPK